MVLPLSAAVGQRKPDRKKGGPEKSGKREKARRRGRAGGGQRGEDPVYRQAPQFISQKRRPWREDGLGVVHRAFDHGWRMAHLGAFSLPLRPRARGAHPGAV